MSYDIKKRTCAIPNYEVKQEFEKSVRDTGWEIIADALERSEKLLADTLAGKAQAVADAIDLMHLNSTSILKYNDENSLANTITLAYYSAQREYKVLRELPSGKGFADIVLVPYRTVNKPAIIVELKWEQSAETAIDQIHRQQYVRALEGYVGEVVLVGVNYSKEDKQHECHIERVKLNGLHFDPQKIKNDPQKLKNASQKKAEIDKRRTQIEMLVNADNHITKEMLSEKLQVNLLTI